MITENARIESVSLGLEDHGIMTAWLHLRMNASGQGFGGYALHTGPYMAVFVTRVLETVGVEAWEKLPGKPLRIERDNGKIYRIGHFMEDRWFDPQTEFAALVDSEKGTAKK